MTRQVLGPDEQRRVQEIEELAAGGAPAVPRLIEALADRSWIVRRRVIAAVAALGDDAVRELCQALRTQRDNENRVAALVDALAASTGAVDSAVLDLASDANPAVVVDVAQVLGRRRSQAGVACLVELTSHADDNVAVAALEALGRIGGRAAVDALVGSVQSGNFFRTFPAIDVLGRSGDPRAVPALAALLDNPTYALEAARALGRTADRNATQPLSALLGRQSDAIARVASQALLELEQGYATRYGFPGTIESTLRNTAPLSASRRLEHAIVGAGPTEQIAICWVLGALGDHAAVQTLTRLLDSTTTVASAAALALKKLERDSGADLLEALNTGDSARRLVILPMLAAHYSSAAAVSNCLSDPSPPVRALACETLARIGNPVAVRALFERLSDTNPGVVHAAVAAIQSLGSAETETLALRALHGSDERVRRAALRIIGYFGYNSALDAVLEIIAGDSTRLGETAIEALPFIEDPRAMEALLEAARHTNPKARAAAMRALSQCERDLRVTSYLLRALTDPDPWVRYYACRSLGRLEWEAAAEPITRLLSDDAGQVRVAAVEALSHLHSDLAFEALRTSAQSNEPDLRRAAVLGLGIGKWVHALPVLVDAARSSDPATRLVAVSAIADFAAPEALETLGKAAADDDETVRNAAIGFLAARPTIDATRLLIGLLKRDATAEHALSALSLLSEGRINGILEALEIADDELAPRLVSALARMRHTDGAHALIRAAAVSNPAARKAVAPALAAIGGSDALSALRRLSAGDPDNEVRRVSALALAQ